MNQKFCSYSDEQLINLYSKKLIERRKVENYIFKKYLSSFRSISYKYMRKIYNAATYQHDLVSLSYDAISISINNYINSNTNIRYVAFLKRTYSCLILDYIKKFTRKKHQILNNSIKYNDELENSFNNDFKDKIYDKLLIEKIFGDYFNLNNLEKRVIKKKLNHEKDKNIAKSENLPLKHIYRIHKNSIKKIQNKLRIN